MSRSAKDVVHDTLNVEMVDYNCLTCGHGQKETIRSKSERVVAALDKAHLLAHTHSVSLDVYDAKVARLTRERDEARRKEADTSDAMVYVMQSIESATGRKGVAAMFVPEALERWRRDLVASAASPEVRRVVELAEKWRKEWCYTPVGTSRELIAAVDALAASRPPKAREPRYEVVASSGGWQEGGCVRSIKTQELVFGSWRGICDDDSLAVFHKARCEAEAARLNAGGAR